MAGSRRTRSGSNSSHFHEVAFAFTLFAHGQHQLKQHSVPRYPGIYRLTLFSKPLVLTTILVMRIETEIGGLYDLFLFVSHRIDVTCDLLTFELPSKARQHQRRIQQNDSTAAQ
jgi:hypothetical protein